MFGRIILAAALVVGGLVVAAPASSAASCDGLWTIGIGGLGNNDSSAFPTVDQRVGYNSFDTRSGVNELNRLIRDHRGQCPGDHIKAIGHSGGAAALHVWASENGRTIGGKVNIILLSDPKRPAGPGGPGFAATDWPFNTIQPLAGADGNYGGLPTWQVCNGDDHICNSQSGWDGYLFRGRHNAYDFDVNHYSNSANGQDFR